MKFAFANDAELAVPDDWMASTVADVIDVTICRNCSVDMLTEVILELYLELRPFFAGVFKVDVSVFLATITVVGLGLKLGILGGLGLKTGILGPRSGLAELLSSCPSLVARFVTEIHCVWRRRGPFREVKIPL